MKLEERKKLIRVIADGFINLPIPEHIMDETRKHSKVINDIINNTGFLPSNEELA